MTPQKLLPLSQAAKILGTTTRTLNRHKSQLGAFKVGHIFVIPEKNLGKFKPFKKTGRPKSKSRS